MRDFLENVKCYYLMNLFIRKPLRTNYSCLTVYAILKKEYKNLKEITLEFPGGKLYLSENNKGEIILRGPALYVFKGEI